jgi:hypothetical protein
MDPTELNIHLSASACNALAQFPDTTEQLQVVRDWGLHFSA